MHNDIAKTKLLVNGYNISNMSYDEVFISALNLIKLQAGAEITITPNKNA